MWDSRAAFDTIIQSSTVDLFHACSIAVAPLARTSATRKAVEGERLLGMIAFNSSSMTGSATLSVPSAVFATAAASGLTLAPKGRSSAKHGFLVRGTHVLSTADVLWMAYPQRYRARPRRSPQKDPFGKLHKTIDYPGVPITTRPSRKTTQVVDGNWGIHAIVKKALFAAGG